MAAQPLPRNCLRPSGLRLAAPGVARSWIIRADPLFRSRVLGVERLRVPAGRFLAYRIRIDSDLFGANDRVFVWYGRKGFLKFWAHLELPDTDQDGNLTHIVTTEDQEVLDGFNLVGRARD